MKAGATKMPWDPDMDDMLLRMDDRKMSYQTIASALSVILGFEITMRQVRYRLYEKRGPGKPRGVPFGSQARELICR
jgi:hypothetical protein